MPILDSLLRTKAVSWPGVYMNREKQLGATATIFNVGDVLNFGKMSAQTGTGMRFNASGLAPTWTMLISDVADTWSNLTFNTVDPGSYQGDAPILVFNGTTMTATAPDDNYWSPGDSSNDTSFSIFAWCNLTDATDSCIMSKRPSVSAGSEWMYEFQGADKMVVYFRDVSAGVDVYRLADAAQTTDQGSWHFYGFVFDVTAGSGTTAMNGVTLYRDGVVLASTATNNASYVAMENSTITTRVGARGATGTVEMFDGKMLGGPFGPFYVQVALTAAQVANMYQFERLLIGV